MRTGFDPDVMPDDIDVMPDDPDVIPDDPDVIPDLIRDPGGRGGDFEED